MLYSNAASLFYEKTEPAFSFGNPPAMMNEISPCNHLVVEYI